MDFFKEYANPYGLCSQTVTVYREEGGAVSRRVVKGAYLDFNKTENTGKTGQQEANGFLLVVPGPVQAVRAKDKVYHGVGPEVPADAMKWWRTFVPANVDGLVVVKHVDCKFFGGRMVHTEAGG